MNKLPHEQNSPATTAEQDDTDFYARITLLKDKIIETWDRATEASRLDAMKVLFIITSHPRSPIPDDAIYASLLIMLEQAERRAAEAEERERHTRGLYNAMVRAATELVTKQLDGDISQDRETLASGDMPPGGAA